MRQRIRSARRIKAGRRPGEQGSIVLEAAIVMPMVMMTLLVFIIFLRLCIVQMALNSAVSQAVREVAAHIHPVYLAWQEARKDQAESSDSTLPAEQSEWRDIAAEAAGWLPEPAGALVSSALKGDWQPLQNMAAAEIGRGVIEPFIRQFANEAVLDPQRMRLQRLELPDMKEKKKAHIAIEAEYEFSLRWPFGGRPIMLRAQALERVWVSDPLAADYGAQRGGSNMPLQIVAIEPTPLRPGRKATVIVKAAPEATVSLEVMYKSGKSKAKHLGDATADASGYVKWTWHVSGNTTPGMWQLTVSALSAASGSVSKHFAVEKYE